MCILKFKIVSNYFWANKTTWYKWQIANIFMAFYQVHRCSIQLGKETVMISDRGVMYPSSYSTKTYIKHLLCEGYKDD